GKHPEKFTKAAALCEQAGFDGIDINFGCPAKKVAGHGGGVTLMRDLEKCRQIIEATLAGTKLPVSVKLRSSINSSPLIRGRLGGGKNDNFTPPRPVLGSSQYAAGILADSRFARFCPSDYRPPYKGEGGGTTVTALDFIKYMKGLPIAAVMIHGRSYEKPFDGEIDYEMIKSVKNFLANSKTIVLGNGGIETPQDAKIMLEKTGCDGLGLARGVCGKPWLFKQIKDYLETGKYNEIKISDLKKTILNHAQLAFKSKGEHGIIELRKHLLWCISGLPGAKEMRKQLVVVENLEDIKEFLKELQ
ncbi:MAG: tRNA-dihydrouridine synthase, partial [Patescibacteria group bacterium]